jgi:hypothetical protein
MLGASTSSFPTFLVQWKCLLEEESSEVLAI